MEFVSLGGECIIVHSSEQCRVHCVISVRRSSTAEVHTSASHTLQTILVQIYHFSFACCNKKKEKKEKVLAILCTQVNNCVPLASHVFLKQVILVDCDHYMLLHTQ